MTRRKVVGKSASEKELSDKELGALLKRGDERAIELLERRFGRDLKRVIASGLADKSEADDVLQDTWVNAFQSSSSLREEGKVRQWLLRIASNRAQTYNRARKRRLSHVAPVSIMYPETEKGGNILEDLAVLDPSSEPKSYGEEGTGRDRVLQDIGEIVSDMPEEHRRLIDLKREGKSKQEIADELGIKVGTVGSRWYRILDEAREKLGLPTKRSRLPLSPSEQQAVDLFKEELSPIDISRKLGSTRNVVESQLHSAVEKQGSQITKKETE